MTRTIGIPSLTLLTSAVALLVAGCGGGSDTPVATPAPPPPAALSVQGTAATGLAMANAAVDVKCASGTGTATTGADGRYMVTITSGSLPCVLKVTPTTGTPLHSAIGGTGTGTVTVNVTPLTELIVAKAAGGSPADLFASFDANAQGLVSAQNLQTAVQSVATALQGVVDLTGIDPIKDPLVAATASGATGNALDQKLDALQAALAAAQTTLADVTTAVVASGATAAPVQTLLQPAATGCAGFRSGEYVALNPSETEPEWALHTFHLDAPTLKASFFDGSSVTVVDKGACSYEIPDDGVSVTKFLVSKSGLAFARDTFTSGNLSGKTDVSVIIPKQTIPLSELAGTWNALQYIRDNTSDPLAASRLTLTIDAAGKITAGTACDTSGACASFEPQGKFSVNANGGFDMAEAPGDTPSRAFAFKTPDGHVSLFILDPNTLGMVVATKQAALTLPAVDTVTAFWDFTVEPTGFATALVDSSVTVTAIDAAAGTYTRTRASDGRVDTHKINDPGVGLRSRAANSCTVVNCAGLVAMPLPGTGVAFYMGTAPSNFFGISINKP